MLASPLFAAAGLAAPGSTSTHAGFVRVALPVPLGRAFTYGSGDLATVPPAGSRVLVEFGRRKCLGVVVETGVAAPAELAPERVKPVLAILDEAPALDAELLGFLLELARYYLAPLGEVLRLALPALERSLASDLEATAGKKMKAVGRLVQVAVPRPGATPDPEKPLGKSAAALWARLLEDGAREVAPLSREVKGARSALEKLVERGLVTIERHTRAADPFFALPLDRDTPPTLNGEQTEAVAALTEALGTASARNAQAFLLDGVTASGKTEVYLHAAERALALGHGVMLLVPEIALTPQLVARFRARLGDAIAVWHSELSEPARLAMWKSLKSGEKRVVVGARSALFAPVRDLRLICVDEEHDPSYKQEEGVRYNARDMALLRAHRAGAVCVLGSATPSLASEHAVRNGRLRRLWLRTRAHGEARLPAVEIIDLKNFGAGPSGDPLLSLPLHRAIEDNLQQGGQTILFLNRRGFAPSLLCNGCGTIVSCPNCSVALTLHRARGARLECHYCDHQEVLPPNCPSCGAAKLTEEGLGTERVEALLSEQFPGARLARLDRDVARGSKSEKILDRMRAGEIDILVGTQMVTKGHDLPEVTLVGVLNADSALSLPDFRAAERTFQLLVQVAGRAGRADRPGRVLIQTRNPQHPAVAYAARHDVRSFIEQEFEAREEVGYPPFSRVALVRFEGPDEAVVRQRAAQLARRIESLELDLEVLGPAPAPLAKLRNRYRHRFLLRARSRAPLFEALRLVAQSPVDRAVKTTIDVDPMTML